MEIINKRESEKAKVGDLIKFNNGIIGLVLKDNEIILLKYSNDLVDDWMEYGLKKEFKERKYTILAKKDEWDKWDIVLR